MYNNKQDIINNTSEGISNKYALCIVDVNNLGTRTFSYLIPEHLKATIKVGQAVSVPFGFRKQNIIAFVAGFSNYLEEGIKAKEIIKIIDEKSVFSLEYLKMLDSSGLTSIQGILDLACILKQSQDLKNYFYQDDVNQEDF